MWDIFSARLKAGSAKLAKMVIMAITISNSINVNPAMNFIVAVFIHYGLTPCHMSVNIIQVSRKTHILLYRLAFATIVYSRGSKPNRTHFM